MEDVSYMESHGSEMPPVLTGNPAIRWVLLFAKPIAHKNYIIQLNCQLTCGPGVRATGVELQEIPQLNYNL